MLTEKRRMQIEEYREGAINSNHGYMTTGKTRTIKTRYMFFFVFMYIFVYINRFPTFILQIG